MNTQNNRQLNEQYTEPVERSEQPLTPSKEKKQFIEPTVSVPMDVLEATTFFQAPTIEGTSV